ncbi:MAG: MAPEG family protein [Tateyamaria sp.]|uniref:MAPEG family protein n=1 Tax=Tateyamaria sp. TaxID=1929288 RepID=UPI003293C4EA
MTELSLPITTALASVLSIWLLVLSVAVIRLRRAHSVSLGDGGVELLNRRTRAQANLTEYAPLFVIMIAVAEAQGGNALFLGLVSIVFVGGRFAHGFAIAFSRRNVRARVGGMMCTFAALALAAVYNLLGLVF